MSAEAPLFGLVLAGGSSTRMQRDKAAIEYHGQSQLQWTFQLLSHVCAATFVSVRPDQREEPTRAGLPQIVDRQPGIGPIAGISAALQAHPKAAWLVVACDLPFLSETTLRHLVARRDPTKLATAYRSSHDALPEPLCAIWEPLARESLHVPPHHPPVRSVLPGLDGTIWLAREDDGAGMLAWWVLDRAGEPIGEVFHHPSPVEVAIAHGPLQEHERRPLAVHGSRDGDAVPRRIVRRGRLSRSDRLADRGGQSRTCSRRHHRRGP